MHTYTVGETGAGKTTRFVMQSIRALSSMPERPSFLITDIHGEILENLYSHLKEHGYTIKVLNCDDPTRSDTYNPFATMVQNCQCSGEIDDETHNMIRRIAEIMQPVQSTQDPIWDMGARSYTHGCILDLFETLLEGNIPPKCITLYNLIENHYWLRQKLGEYASLDSVDHFSTKPRTSMAIQKILGVTENADKTRRSYWGVVENHYDVFGQTTMYRLSSSNNISVEEFLEKPTVIVVQSGSAVCGDHLVSLLVNDIYTAIVRKGRQQRIKRLNRRVHCFLDEFANCHVADGPSFIKMLTTSRKFGMHWHMLLQSDAQIDRKYDKSISSIVRANCTEIFLGSNDFETAVRFANACGQKTMESLATRTTQQAPVLETVALLTPDRLNLLEQGHAYVRSRRHPLLHTYYEAFYNCEEYNTPVDLNRVYPHNHFDYRLTAFFPDDVLTLEKGEWQVVEYVHNCGFCRETELTAIMPEAHAKRYVQLLCLKKIIVEDNGLLHLGINQNHYELLRDKMRKKLAAEEAVTPFDAVTPLTDNGITMDEILGELPAGVQELENVSHFSCIPQYLAGKLLEVSMGGDPQLIRSGVRSIHMLKYEVLEAFIGANDYVSKEQWVAAFSSQLRRIEQRGWFSQEALESFRMALKEMDEELTLGNILEIKRIIASED